MAKNRGLGSGFISRNQDLPNSGHTHPSPLPRVIKIIMANPLPLKLWRNMWTVSKTFDANYATKNDNKIFLQEVRGG